MTRPLPEKMFFGLGGQRCGSSWLHANLSRHPGVCAPNKLKEVHFFDRHYARGLDWYAQHYGPADGPVWWDATPYYLYDSRAADRIADAVPDPRFVILLRDPLARSLSHYQRFVTNSGCRPGLEKAISARPSILGFSKYSQHLAPYFDRFGRDRFYIGLYEDIEARPEELLTEILAFLELAPLRVAKSILSRRVNGARMPRHKGLYAAIETSKGWMQRNGLGGAVAFGRSLGVRGLVTASVCPVGAPLLREGERDLLDKLRDREFLALSQLGLDVTRWQAKDLV